MAVETQDLLWRAVYRRADGLSATIRVASSRTRSCGRRYRDRLLKMAGIITKLTIGKSEKKPLVPHRSKAPGSRNQQQAPANKRLGGNRPARSFAHTTLTSTEFAETRLALWKPRCWLQGVRGDVQVFEQNSACALAPAAFFPPATRGFMGANAPVADLGVRPVRLGKSGLF